MQEIIKSSTIRKKGYMKYSMKLFWFLLFWQLSSVGFSASYFYDLYIHNEYYAEPPGFPSKLVILPLVASFSGKGDQWHENRLAGGIVGAVRFVHDHTWIEFVTAYGKEKMKFNHLGQFGKASRAGWDDFIIDFGHNFLDKTGKKQLLLHWLIGIPLIQKVTLEEVQSPLWGTRTYATGPVIEFAYDFIRNYAQDFFFGIIGRFLHRYERSYEPILPRGTFFHPGNALDILILLHNRYYEHNVEIGYVYTHYNHISLEAPTGITRLPSERYNSFYVDYFYYYEKRSLGFEVNITKTFGKPFEGITVFSALTWYF